jgi:hypothetical protein
MPLKDDKNSVKVVPESLEAFEKLAGLDPEATPPKN